MTHVEIRTHHESDPPSTPCPACREWERDMNGTLATLAAKREKCRGLLEAADIALRRFAWVIDQVNRAMGHLVSPLTKLAMNSRRAWRTIDASFDSSMSIQRD